MIREYNETFFSRLHSDIQEQLYLMFNKAPSRDKILLFTKLKYGDEITFKDISEKMHISTARTTYSNCINALSGVYC